MNIEAQACHHQREAAHHALQAHNARSCMWVTPRREHYRNLAVHHQSMARFHHERAWMFLLSLLLRDPII